MTEEKSRRFRMSFRGVLALFLTGILFTGCVSVTDRQSGVEIPLSGDSHTDLLHLQGIADEMMSLGKGKWTTAEVMTYLRGKFGKDFQFAPNWDYDPLAQALQLKWRSESSKKKTISIPVYSWRESSGSAIEMAVQFTKGTLFNVPVRRVSTDEFEKMLTSNELLLLGVAAGAAFFLAP